MKGRLYLDDFDGAAADGLLSAKDDGSLRLFCYTPRCVHDRAWNPTTRAARGIIFDSRTGECVARPFPKFFNLGEMPETMPNALPDLRFAVEDKIDGSLGIAFFYAGQWQITTKGAFHSEQARFAAMKLLPKLNLDEAPRDHTLLFEIIYPDNRIVVDYGETERLTLLSAIETNTGKEKSIAGRAKLAKDLRTWTPELFQHRDVRNLPHGEAGTAREGYVVRYADGLRVKVKAPQYLTIHRLIDRVSPKRVLDMIEQGSDDETRALIPDDLAGEFDDVHATLKTSIDSLLRGAAEVYGELEPLLKVSRKEFAQKLLSSAPSRVVPLAFALADGKDERAAAIKVIRREMSASTDGPRSHGMLNAQSVDEHQIKRTDQTGERPEAGNGHAQSGSTKPVRFRHPVAHTDGSRWSA